MVKKKNEQAPAEVPLQPDNNPNDPGFAPAAEPDLSDPALAPFTGAQVEQGNGACQPKGPGTVVYILSGQNRYTGAREPLVTVATRSQLLRWLQSSAQRVPPVYTDLRVLRCQDLTAALLGGGQPFCSRASASTGGASPSCLA